MFGPNHYVPILKTRSAEFTAFENLRTGIKRSLTPIMEMMPPESYSDETKIIEHLDSEIQRFIDSWGDDDPIFVDLKWIDDSQSVTGVGIIEYIFDLFRNVDIKVIPVTGMRRSFVYQSAIKNVIVQDQLGLCLRLESTDFHSLSAVPGLINLLGVNEKNTDVVIDMNRLGTNDWKMQTLTVINVLNSLPKLSAWRTLSLVSSAFPDSLRTITKDSTDYIQRVDWLLWQELYRNRHLLNRMISFGDYGIDVPELPPEFRPFIKINANIRYTSTDHWLIVKGHILKKGDYVQYYDLASTLYNHPEYSGASFSWGDNRIQKYAKRQYPTAGGPGQWREIGYSHHFTLVIDQLANLSWP